MCTTTKPIRQTTSISNVSAGSLLQIDLVPIIAITIFNGALLNLVLALPFLETNLAFTGYHQDNSPLFGIFVRTMLVAWAAICVNCTYYWGRDKPRQSRRYLLVQDSFLPLQVFLALVFSYYLLAFYHGPTEYATDKKIDQFKNSPLVPIDHIHTIVPSLEEIKNDLRLQTTRLEEIERSLQEVKNSFRRQTTQAKDTKRSANLDGCFAERKSQLKDRYLAKVANARGA